MPNTSKASAAADSAPSRDMHLAGIPADHTPVDPGTRNLLAEQSGQKDALSGAYDPVQVQAGEDALNFDELRRAQADVDRVLARQSKIKNGQISDALIDDAEAGALIDSGAQYTRNLVATKDELLVAEKQRDRANAAANESAEILAGDRLDSTKTPRSGEQIDPGTTSFRGAIRRASIAEWLPLIVPIFIEGTVVTFNMYSYARTSTYVEAVALAITALFSLTLAPFLLGRVLSATLSLARLRIRELVPLAVITPLWLVAGIVLALVRVSVDQANAVAKVAASQRQAVSDALEQGNAAPTFAPISPSAVFDPTLPTIMWIVFLLGIGAVLIVWEALHHNPVRITDLKNRRWSFEATTRVNDLTERVDAIIRSMALQEKAKITVDAMWDAEFDAIAARTAVDIAIYDSALVTTSGDPEMLGAIELRRRRIFEAIRATTASDDGATASAQDAR